MRVLAATVIAAVAVASVLASSQDEKLPKGKARLIVVQGCLNGSRLDVTRPEATGGSSIDHFTLRANKDLMNALKDLKGHLVEITGAMDDPAGKQGMGKTLPIGKKSTLTFGERPGSSRPDPATDPVISVDSYKDISTDCTDK